MSRERVLVFIAGSVSLGVCLFVDGNSPHLVIGQERVTDESYLTSVPEDNSSERYQETESEIQEVAKIKQEVAEFERRRRCLVNHLVAGLRECQNIHDLHHVRLSSRNPARGSLLPDELSHIEEALIVAAGRIRAEECTDLLLNRITKRQNYNPQTEAEIAMLNPRRHFVYEALREIGKPACKAALIRIPIEADQESRILMTCLLCDCLGEATAREWLINLRDHIESSKNEERDRVAAAITQLDTGLAPCGVF